MSTPEQPPLPVVTPMESAYIRALLPAVLPAVNGLIYATNLDVVLHITKLTTDQLWQFTNAILAVVSIGMVLWKRIKDGNDPKSQAPKIVMTKPGPEIVLTGPKE